MPPPDASARPATRAPVATPTAAEVERRLAELYIAVDGAAPRREDRKKAVEVAAMLGELARVVPHRVLVDAAAGKAYVGLLAAEMLGAASVTVIEREPARVAQVRVAASQLRRGGDAVCVRAGDVGDPALWPAAPAIVAALHACGPASDAVLDGAVRAGATWLLLVPCCYGASVPFAAAAAAHADALGVPRHAPVRARVIAGLIDAERTLRLEAAGYETTVVPLVAPTVSPHHLLWRARRVGEPSRMAAAAARLARLRAPA